MDQELKQKWVDALRSGKYKQGKGWLKSSHGEFCCLGVLCDISGIALTNRYGTHAQILTEREGYDFFGGRGKEAGPHVSVIDKYGFRVTLSLAEANDDGCTFEDIADAIEEQL